MYQGSGAEDQRNRRQAIGDQRREHQRRRVEEAPNRDAGGVQTDRVDAVDAPLELEHRADRSGRPRRRRRCCNGEIYHFTAGLSIPEGSGSDV